MCSSEHSIVPAGVVGPHVGRRGRAPSRVGRRAGRCGKRLTWWPGWRPTSHEEERGSSHEQSRASRRVAGNREEGMARMRPCWGGGCRWGREPSERRDRAPGAVPTARRRWGRLPLATDDASTDERRSRLMAPSRSAVYHESRATPAAVTI